MRRIALSIATVIAVLAGLIVASPASAAAGGTIQGYVHRTGAADSTDSYALLYKVSSGTFVSVGYAMADATGFYSFSNVEPGDYTMKFADATAGSTFAAEYWDNANSIQQATVFTLASGQTTVKTATLEQGGSISVSVVGGPSKMAVANAYVVVFPAIAGGVGSAVDNGTADASGNVTINKLRPGKYRIEISRGDYYTEYWNDLQYPSYSDTIAVTAGETAGPLGVWLNNYAASTDFFQDVPPSNPFYDDINWMWTNGMSLGTAVIYERPSYKPSDTVSRQAMAAFLSRYLSGPFVPPATPHFSDVPTNHPFYSAIEWMYASGISTGTEQPSGLPLYKPNDAVSRQAMALFLTRAAQVTPVAPVTAHFADVGSTSPYYAAIEWMYLNNISTGTAQPSGLPLYKPTEPVSRQAMAAFLHRFDQRP